MRYRLSILLFFCVGLLSVQADARFGELARMLAVGWFKPYVAQEASVAECVAFLNSKGVCFSPFDIMDPARKVTKEDVARVVGQSTLLFSGEAELENGCVVKPLEAQTWIDYCLLNDINLDDIWNRFALQTAFEKE